MKPVIIITIAFVLLIPVNVYALETNPQNIDLSTTNPAELVITGEIDQFQGSTRLVLTIVSPDNSQTEYDVRIVESGPFSKSIIITEDWKSGNYTVYGKYGDVDLGKVNFIIEEPYDPRKATVPEETESSFEDTNEKPITAAFVDPSKDPQYYIDRYNSEETYKKWFDENYPDYSSIYEAVGSEAPTAQKQPRFSDPVLNDLDRASQSCPTYECQLSFMYSQIQYANERGYLQFPSYGMNTDSQPVAETEPVCNLGTKLENGICQIIIENELKQVPYNTYVKQVQSHKFSILPPHNWVINDNKNEIGRDFIVVFDGINKYKSLHPPMIGIVYENRGSSFGNYIKNISESDFLKESENQLMNDNTYKIKILESNVQSDNTKKTGTVLISQELTDSNGESFLTYHLMKTLFYYSGEFYEFHLYSIPTDYEKSLTEFNKSTSTFHIGSVEKSPPPEIACGTGTIEKNGQCAPDPNYKSQTNSIGGGCLIATATYGSELAPEVQQLRELRDNQLLQTESGTSFMKHFNDFYYSFSPIIADYERENPIFKEAVKIAITPMISSLSILNYVDMDSEESVLGYGISLILLNIAMYIGIPAIVVIGISKRK